MPARYIDCELHVAAWDRASLSVAGRTFRDQPVFDDKLIQRLHRPLRGHLQGEDLEATLYGALLFEAAFPPGSELLAGYREARNLAYQAQRMLRLRLAFDPRTPAEIRDFDWELLYDPRDEHALGRSREVMLSRFQSVQRPPRVQAVEYPRLLVALAAPDGLGELGLPEIDRERMRRALVKAFRPIEEHIEIEILDGATTPGRLRERLLDGDFHMLHLQAQGLMPAEGDVAQLVLEDGDGRANPQDDRFLADLLSGIPDMRLLTLVSCHGGEPESRRPFGGLGPALVDRGLPAVIAARRPLGVGAAARFAKHLYLRLALDDPVDAAISEARLQLYLTDPKSKEWGCPALFTRLVDNLLWDNEGTLYGASLEELLADLDTGEDRHEDPESFDTRVPGLTVLWHPDASRVGDRAPLPGLAAGGEVFLSRKEPLFGPAGADPVSLNDPHLSRRPIRLMPADEGGVVVVCGETMTEVAVNGETVASRFELSAADLDRGVTLVLASRVALLLHRMEPFLSRRVPSYGLVGTSAASVRVRRRIEQLRERPVPALVRGEEGTGRRQVARALHRASELADGPFVTFDLRDSAADAQDPVQEALGGTLFVTDVAQARPDERAWLRRIVELHVTEPRNAGQPSDLRVVGATADLEKNAVKLLGPETYEIRLTPLRERRQDVGSLFLHFLREAVADLGHSGEMRSGKPWVAAALVARLARHDWPGNVEELRGFVRALIAEYPDATTLALTPEVEKLLGGGRT